MRTLGIKENIHRARAHGCADRKPLASLAIVVMETGVLVDLPALSAALVTVESLHPASKRLAETSAAGKIFNRI